MAEVRVHLKEVRVAGLQAPLESGDVGGAEAELAGPFEQVDAALVSGSGFPDEVRCAVGGAVIDHQHVEGFTALGLEGHDGVEHPGDVLLLVVGRYDDEAVGHGRCNIVQRDMRRRFNSSSVSMRQWPLGRSFLVKGPSVVRSRRSTS